MSAAGSSVATLVLGAKSLCVSVEDARRQAASGAASRREEAQARATGATAAAPLGRDRRREDARSMVRWMCGLGVNDAGDVWEPIMIPADTPASTAGGGGAQGMRGLIDESSESPSS